MNTLTKEDGTLQDNLLRTHYGIVTLEPAKEYFVPGDSKIQRMVFQGLSPMDPNLMMFMIVSINAKGQDVSNLEFINKNSPMAKTIWSQKTAPAGYSPPPEMMGYRGALARIDPANCQFYLTVTRPKGSSPLPLVSSLSFTGRNMADEESVTGRLKIKVMDGAIVSAEIV